ncbi:hypothetical protein PUNSTDRAFT_49326 [Punctularia strigosozonata HHB-11173 SS5]|uniref:uncharacterized protein n=1 Tax=Punctularia strigosozonata (strain HHB-11173) TaxID=741275 RepID=UPI00044183F2|nr:uncharacterized protein PUNSTDRAFT_49326 [Punctularia strigosozonata HHB-11173 SS5]EIN14589.1 hypothetical protein PUNSTDRAFT_49326 [Punctularia strigosozonata HHB-11173 SS5]
MTRTERSAFPRAVAKDRHEPKNGIDKHIPKNGTGGHNWGNPAKEYELEAQAFEDEQLEFDPDVIHPKSGVERRAERASVSSLSQEERDNAVKFRKNALKADGIDLGSIARTSAAVSTSPPNQSIPITNDADTSKLKPDELT